MLACSSNRLWIAPVFYNCTVELIIIVDTESSVLRDRDCPVPLYCKHFTCILAFSYVGKSDKLVPPSHTILAVQVDRLLCRETDRCERTDNDRMSLGSGTGSKQYTSSDSYSKATPVGEDLDRDDSGMLKSMEG